MAGGKQLLYVVRTIDGHDTAACLAVRRVQGDRKRQLQILLRQGVDARHDAAGGKRDVAHADIQPVRMVDKLQKTQDRLAVIKRLTNAHEDDIGDLPAGVKPGKEHLVEHLRGAQIAHLACDR